VRLRGRADRRVTIGARAASKVLVLVTKALMLLWMSAGAALAQGAPNGQPGPAPFAISDNSFLVEEALNQETGIFQNIFGAIRIDGHWTASFTQEWPAPSQTHQLSYTIAWADTSAGNGFGDTLINYRYQATTEAPGRPAFSPRVSLVVPSGRVRTGLGSGSAGLQFNLPFSKQTGDWFWHWNAGLTWLPRARAEFTDGGASLSRRANLASPFLAGSGIYRMRKMVHLMLESFVAFDESIAPEGTVRETSLTLSPGVRGGWNAGDRQIVVGAAVPMTWHDGQETGVFLYFSYELPFRK
jgi:hypothetical protein